MTRLHLALLAALVAAAYANSLDVPFQFDDHGNIVDYAVLRNPAWLFDPEAARPFVGPDQHGMLVRRWVGVATMAANFALGGLDVRGYHAVNIGIHLGASLLVYALVRLLFRTPALAGARIGAAPTALATAALFAVHPLQTQAVTYVVQRFTSLAALFYLAAVVTWLGGRLGSRRWWALSLLATVLAMTTKEITFTLPFMEAPCELALFRGPLLRRMGALWPWALTLVIVPAGVLLTGSAPADAASAGQTMSGFRAGTAMSPSTYLLSELPVIARYLGLLLVPVGQTIDHDPAVRTSLADPVVLGAGVLVLGLAGTGLVLVRQQGETVLVGLGLLWFLLALSVESSVAPIADLMFEHRAYLPSVGILLGVAVGVLRLVPDHRRRVLVLGTMVVLLVLATHQRNRVWQSPVTLWAEAAARSPDKPRALMNLGGALVDAGDAAAALPPLERALVLKPDYVEAHVALAKALAALGRHEEANRHFARAAALSPGSLDLLLAQGNALARQGAFTEALRLFEQAAALAPRHAGVQKNLAICALRAGQVDRALAALARAGALDRALTEDAELHYAFGSALGPLGRLDEAVVHLEAAIRLDPGMARAWGNLGTALLARGDIEEARRHYRRALELDPDYAEARTNLALVEERLGGAP